MDGERAARKIEQIYFEGGAELEWLCQIFKRVGTAYQRRTDWHDYIERQGLDKATLTEKEAAITASERGIEAMSELWQFLAEEPEGGGGR
jgi:hypothetical protein